MEDLRVQPRSRRNSVDIGSWNLLSPGRSRHASLEFSTARKPEFEGKEKIAQMLKESYRESLSPTHPDLTSKLASEIIKLKEQKIQNQFLGARAGSAPPFSSSVRLNKSDSLSGNKSDDVDDQLFERIDMMPSPRLRALSGELNETLHKLGGYTEENSTFSNMLTKLKREMEDVRTRSKKENRVLQEKEEMKMVLELELNEINEKLVVEQRAIAALLQIKKMFEEKKFKNAQKKKSEEEVEKIVQAIKAEQEAKEQALVEKQQQELDMIKQKWGKEKTWFEEQLQHHKMKWAQEKAILVAQVEGLRREMETQRQKYSKDQKDYEEAKNVKDKYDMEKKMFEEKRSALEKENADMKAQIRKLEDSNWKLGDQLEKSHDEKRALSLELDKMKNKFHLEMKTRDELEERKSKLEVELLELNEIMEADMKAYEQNVKELKASESAMKKQMDQLNQNLESERSAKRMLENTKKELEAEIARQKQINQETTQALQSMTKQYKEESLLHDKADKSNKNLTKQLKKQQQASANLEKELNSMTKQYEKEYAQRIQLEQALQKLKTEFEEYKRAAEAIQKTLREELDRMEGKFKKEEEAAAELERKRLKLEQELELTEELAQHEKASAEARIEELTKQLKDEQANWASKEKILYKQLAQNEKKLQTTKEENDYLKEHMASLDQQLTEFKGQLVQIMDLVEVKKARQRSLEVLSTQFTLEPMPEF